jgi:hypothetical protein
MKSTIISFLAYSLKTQELKYAKKNVIFPVVLYGL